MSSLIVIYGEPGVGKTTVGRRVAAMLDVPHVEMSEVALRGFQGDPASVIDYVEKTLWADGNYARVAESVDLPGGSNALVVTGPRRVEEIDHFAAHVDDLRLVHLIAPIEIRAARSTRGSERAEYDRLKQRAQREADWGLVNRLLWERGATAVVNIGNIPDVARRILTTTGFSTASGLEEGISSAWQPEYEHRFSLPFEWRLPEQLLRSSRAWSSINDEWFLPKKVSNFEMHEQWLRNGGAAPVRLRTVSREGLPDDVSLETKRIATVSDFRLNEELRVPLRGNDGVRELLESLGLTHVATIAKSRLTVTLGQYDFCLDDYGAEGRCLEVEARPEGAEPVSFIKPEPALLDDLNKLPELLEPIPLRIIRRSLRDAPPAVDRPATPARPLL